MVAKEKDLLAVLADELSKKPQVSIAWAQSQQEALARMETDAPQVVVVGESLADGPGLPLVKEVIKRDPFINCALVSPLTEEEFHEETEGLGVFMQLPVNPGAQESERMLRLLESIGVGR
jgi:DNA-binding NtrC family response regulator